MPPAAAVAEEREANRRRRLEVRDREPSEDSKTGCEVTGGQLKLSLFRE